jgi:hypothetical protein
MEWDGYKSVPEEMLGEGMSRKERMVRRTPRGTDNEMRTM